MPSTLKILLLSPIQPQCLGELMETHSVKSKIKCIENSANADWEENSAQVVILRSGVTLDRTRLALMNSLKAVIRAGSGIDNIDNEYLSSKNIQLFRIENYHARSVAELVLALFLCLARRIPRMDSMIRRGIWDKNNAMGTEIRGKTVGLVGVGRVGIAIAELCRPLGLKVLGIARVYSEKRRSIIRGNGIDLLEKPQILAQNSDFVSVQLPSTPETKNFISRAFFTAMPRSSYFVNVGRGDTVDSEALHEALARRHIAGAALDVHSEEKGDSPFSIYENVVLTPHIGSSTAETQMSIGNEILRIVTILANQI